MYVLEIRGLYNDQLEEHHNLHNIVQAITDKKGYYACTVIVQQKCAKKHFRDLEFSLCILYYML